MEQHHEKILWDVSKAEEAVVSRLTKRVGTKSRKRIATFKWIPKAKVIVEQETADR